MEPSPSCTLWKRADMQPLYIYLPQARQEMHWLPSIVEGICMLSTTSATLVVRQAHEEEYMTYSLLHSGTGYRAYLSGHDGQILVRIFAPGPLYAGNKVALCEHTFAIDYVGRREAVAYLVLALEQGNVFQRKCAA